jgi:threonyl-tRNA synthetase
MPELKDIPREERLERMRHSAAHIMAEAVMEVFPEAKLGIGPPIDTGFYYDFELPRALSTEDLPDIEERMRKRIESNVPFEPSAITKDEAREMFRDQPYKIELIDEIPPDEEIGLYRQGEFVDLCHGPHVAKTGEVADFKLMSVAGAYWRGSEDRPMLQRIYGALFDTKEELEEYLHNLEEAQKRDHRRLGKELDLFSFHEEFGPGLVYWHPKGGRMRTIIEDFWRSAHYAAGYDIVYTPHIGKSALWETSGHLNFYNENMYSPMDIDGQDYYIKPMNCPFHIQIFKSDIRSYRDLPIRMGELGTVYRYERSGVLHGLLRVRGFTQDDAHIFCTPDQVRSEVERCVDFMMFFLGAFGFEKFHVYLSTRDQKGKWAGSLEDWDMATNTLKDVIEERNLPYDVDEGGAVFYGPKIDVKMIDAIGREWQCTTIQFDFNLPDRFDVSYIAEDGSKQRPFMVHRALLGSMERFFGVLVEHYSGAFPMWLAPVQATVIPIADRHIPYAQQVASQMRSAGLRIEVDERNERMQAKIRDAQLQKIPYMLVVGDRETDAQAAAVRLRSGEDLKAVPITEIIQRMQEEAAQREYAPAAMGSP